MSSPRHPIDDLVTCSRIAVLGGRQAPLPRDTLAHLTVAAIAADGEARDQAEQLLVSAAQACALYPDHDAPLDALRAALSLFDLLREPEPSAPTRWEEKAGLMG